MLKDDEIATVEKMMRRHPGARFSFNAPTETLPYEYFTVGLPCQGVPFGQVFGSGPTLRLAYDIAWSNLRDVQGTRKAA